MTDICPTCGTTDSLQCSDAYHVAPPRFVEVVRCADCTHGSPDEMGDGSPGVCCDVWFYHDDPGGRGREKCWPINALDHYCAKGKRKA